MEFTENVKCLHDNGRTSERDSWFTEVDVVNCNVIILVFNSVVRPFNLINGSLARGLLFICKSLKSLVVYCKK